MLSSDTPIVDGKGTWYICQLFGRSMHRLQDIRLQTILWPWNWGSESLKVIESCTIKSADPKNAILGPNITSIGKPVAKLWPFCIFKMAVSHHLGFYRTANSASRSTDPENPSLEPNMEWIGCTICEIFAFKLYCMCDLETWVRGHSRSSKAVLFDRAHMTSIVNCLYLLPFPR